MVFVVSIRPYPERRRAFVLGHRWSLARVAGASMAPELNDGDIVVVSWRAPLRRGDVVVARHPEQEVLLVKRLAAGPGDEVYGAPLGPRQWWLASDNVLVSPDDSRGFGPVPDRLIVGRVVRRYRPLRTRWRRKSDAASRSPKT
jgi:signal peptidase I